MLQLISLAVCAHSCKEPISGEGLSDERKEVRTGADTPSKRSREPAVSFHQKLSLEQVHLLPGVQGQAVQQALARRN